MRVHRDECLRLKGRNNLTYLVDGWEDRRRRSIYGSMAAEVSQYPVMLGLEDLTGKRATADGLVELSKRALTKKTLDPRAILATCTDNPTTMQAFQRKFKEEYPWIIIFPCFMHSVNTIIGKITAYPPVKDAISKNTRIVSFFNSSHYWGGQLEIAADSRGIKQTLKTLTESRFYALVLLALSVREHRAALTEICNRDDAKRSIHGLSSVNKDVITTVFDLQRWDLTDQLIRICKPLVDVIGNIESRDSNLADCMLELIWAHREVNGVMHQDGDDPGFAKHAMETLQTEFHALNTDLHWFALFLHPLCWKQAEDEVEDLIISEKDVEAEFMRLEQRGSVLLEDGDRLPKDIRINEVYDMSQLDDIQKGRVTISIDEELDLAKASGSSEKWDPDSLMRSHGIR
ncbi:hypothetical protein CPB83DRAFT_833272 [Crepidotus variabilis]|uniref:DUF659 domain-containing protein n=1 Tax=Crepidotus variabilis TaxID=179855 RepID=A0A9P6ELZ0_9AGAR|nr:hypothetical protein CPB83DRAFT_833272 [Crepidotus variabilis]